MAWGSSAASSCKHVRNFAEAERIFTTTRKPRTTRWEEHQRPLRDTRHTHFRLHKGHDETMGDYYGVWLYKTELCRYYKPKEDGSYYVCLNTYYSNTTAAFMWSVLSLSNWRNKRTTTDGQEVYVPLKRNTKYPWAATLWYDARGRLMVDKSWHVPIATKCMDNEDKARRAAKKKEVGVLLDMVRLRLSSMLSASMLKPELRYSGAFSTSLASQNGDDTTFLYDKVVSRPIDEWPQETLGSFFAVCQLLANGYVSRVAVREDMDWEWASAYRNWELRHKKAEFPTKAAQWVLDNPSGFMKVVEAKLMGVAGLERKSGYKLLPQFPEDLPSTVPLYNAPDV